MNHQLPAGTRPLAARTAWRWAGVCALLLVGLAAVAAAAASAPEPKLRLMAGGIDKQIYLPLVLALRLGYFRDEHIRVEVLTEPSGVYAEDQLLAGAVQGVVGFYDHTIGLQAKGKLVKAVVLFSRIPGEVVLVAKADDAAIRSVADLKARPVGVTGLGSSTSLLMKYLATRSGLKVDDLRLLAVGASRSFIAALTGGRIVAGMTTEPTASRLLAADQASVLVDLRTVGGTQAALGGLYPGACLYMRESWIQAHTDEVHKLAAALQRALRYIAAHSDEQIAAIVPAEYLGGSRELYVRALASGREMYTADGHMPEAGPQTVLKVMQSADRNLQGKRIDLSRTWTHEFVDPPH
jgi:NitT/TauT family transport system substrate-binding protein